MLVRILYSSMQLSWKKHHDGIKDVIVTFKIFELEQKNLCLLILGFVNLLYKMYRDKKEKERDWKENNKNLEFLSSVRGLHVQSGHC